MIPTKRALAGALIAAAIAVTAPSAAAAQLPPELHYELVSPLESEGFDYSRAWLFPDGDRGVIGSELSDVNGVFTVRRTAAGWEKAYRRITSPIVTPLIAPATVAVSEDLARIVTGGVKPGSMLMTPNELALSEPDGSWKTIGGPLQLVDRTADLDRLVVQLSLNADRAELFPDFPGPKTDVFLWQDDGSSDGALTAIGADVARLVTCGAEAPDGDSRRQRQSGVSADARTVVLTSRAGCVDPDTSDPIARHVYLWREGQPTVDLSAPLSGADGDTTVVGHTTDLSAVFIRTALALDPADTNDADDVYRYDVAGGERTRLTGAATDAGGTLRTANVSDDGNRLWFGTDDGADATLWVKTGDQAPSAIETTAGSVGDQPFELNAFEAGSRLPAQATPDGSSIVWTTRVPIDGVGGTAVGYDNGQIFRATVDGELDCLSCAADGAPAEFVDFGDVLQTLQIARRVTSEDGSWVYFQTTTALEPGDDNELNDVYAWHDGVRSLISAGDESVGATMAGVSDGGDVFFKSYAQLLPWIDDDHLKVYAARHGDDLPAPRDPREGCLGDACQGDPAPRMPAPGNLSEGFNGPGDENDTAPPFPANPSMRVARLSKAAQRKLATGRAVTLAITSDTAGRVTATTTFKAGRRWRNAATATRTFTRAGTVRLTLRLSRAARAQLTRRGALRLRVDVVHRQVADPRRLAFVLKPAPTRRGARA
ncbi:hypothetical protein VSS74_09685 [Conexibacter stalactiti]|uniref:WD40 repeat protein n=1 Tax=Conexibacter stalactiti TaxID=1940611 RepID=A0ABU4HMR6_9ACTN|nr:hypothetical protein [Conexibacter stalactiti]MDW5594608.1 hypothetical protein [Conexibacter stalactiti]MEC5035250.1 hypothetical protein [Conexibacter stalactiti]